MTPISRFTRAEIAQLYQIVLDSDGLHHVKGDEFRARCTLFGHCGDNDTCFVVHMDTGAFHCFSCGVGGSNIFYFAQEVLRWQSTSNQAPEYEAVIAWIHETLGTPFTERIYSENIKSKSHSGMWDRAKAQARYTFTRGSGYELYSTWRFVDAQGNKQVVPDHPCPCSRIPKGECEPNCKGGRIWGMKGIKHVLYHLVAVLHALLIFVVEGEKNADHLTRALALYISVHGSFKLGNRTYTADEIAVTTNVGGAGNWKSEYNYGLEFTDKIAIKLGDNNQAGRKHNEAACRDICRYADQTFTCDLPVGEDKDISDYLDQHGENAIADFIKLLTTECKLYAPPSSPKIVPDLVCLADVKALPVPWLWPGYLAFTMLSMISGDPDAGKTFIALALAASLSNGRMPITGETCDPVTTLYLSHENSPEHVIRPRFDAQGGNTDRFILLRGSRMEEDEDAVRGNITLKDVAILDAALAQTGAKLVIIDPIQSYLGAEVDAHRSNETRPVMDGLITLAEKYGACVLILRHLTKAPSGRAIHRGLGSIDLTGAVRTEMLAGTAPDEPDNRAFIQIKNNLGRRMGSLAYKITEDESGDEMKTRLEWTGVSTLTAADLQAPEATSGETAGEGWTETIFRGTALLTAEIARRITTGKPPILKTEAATFLMAKGITRNEARLIIASDSFDLMPGKGKGAPIEVHCHVHTGSAAKMGEAEIPNKDAGLDGLDSCRPLGKDTAKMPPSETRMDKDDFKSVIFAAEMGVYGDPPSEKGAYSGPNGKPNGAAGDALEMSGDISFDPADWETEEPTAEGEDR